MSARVDGRVRLLGRRQDAVKGGHVDGGQREELRRVGEGEGREVRNGNGVKTIFDNVLLQLVVVTPYSPLRAKTVWSGEDKDHQGSPAFRQLKFARIGKEA